MLLRFIFRLFCVGAIACCSVFQAAGQFTAPEASADTVTVYLNSKELRDPIFVFNPNESGEVREFGQLLLEEEEAEESDFNWYRFVNDKFEEEPFFTEQAVTSTSKDELRQGGYMVTVTTPGEAAPRDTFVAWLYMNPGFEFELEKDVNDGVHEHRKYCTWTEFYLSRLVTQNTFTYYDPRDGTEHRLVNRISFTMKADNEPEMDIDIMPPLDMPLQITSQLFFHGNPPRKDTDYVFKATDLFGVEKDDEIEYITILPYATIDPPGLPEEDPTSAPVPVTFSSTPNTFSDQNFEYTWRFGNGDSVVLAARPGLETTDTSYIYFRPSNEGYRVTLKIRSFRDCEYITPNETASPVIVEVSNPLLDGTANVFSPGGLNPYFKPEVVSLRQFEILIFTRTGTQIYSHRGDDLRGWEGWNGRFQNNNREAPTGVYYYTLRALGWDDPPTRNPLPGPYSGFFYLFR